MAVEIGAAGIVGVAHETVKGTYIAPDVYIPILSESLDVVQSNVFRRPIRGIVDPVGAVPGPTHVEGSITFEVTDTNLIYFLYAMNATIVKSGTTDLDYTLTPAHSALPQATATLSISIDRNAETFGYVGCVVGSLQLTIQNEIMTATVGIVGESEATQSTPTPTWPTTIPTGIPGDYTIEIPTASQVFDADSFTIDINDNAEPQFRLKDTGRGAQFIKFGEREVTLSMERDFESRTEFDLFKAATAQGITILAEQSVTRSIQFDMESAIHDSYTIGLSGQGDLIRASIDYRGVYNAGDSRSYQIVILTDEDIDLTS